MSFQSLSAKIVSTVFLLVAVAFGADLVIGSSVTSSVSDETDHIIAELTDALKEKDSQLKEALAQSLKLDEKRLDLSHQLAEADQTLKTREAETRLQGMHQGISASVVSLVNQAMMLGEAATAQDTIDTLVENPVISAINLWRVDGDLAFRDNKAIDAVNTLLEDEAFEKRDVLEPVKITGKRAETLKKTVSTRTSGLKVDGELKVDDEKQPVTFAYQLLENGEDCQSCHGENDVPRGVVEVALSRAELLSIQSNARASIAELMEGQKKDLDKLRAQNKSKADEMDKVSNELAAQLDKDRHHLDDLNATATFWTIAPKVAFFVISLVLLLVLLRRLLTRPLNDMSGTMHRLAGGDLEVEVPATDRTDEIGEMAQAVLVFQENGLKLAENTRELEENTRQIQQLAEEQETAHHRDQRKLQAEMQALTNALDEEVQAAIGIVLKEAEGMQEAASSMSKAVSRTNQKSDAAANAAEEASTSVDGVASAVEELAASIHGIRERVGTSTQISTRAVDEAETTNTRIHGLAEASGKIGEVINLISDIAEQTNLLALNATIEAARAGEAGKGFAVVASEVKNLANQTARATEEISSQVEGIQSATTDAVQAIGRITDVISEISENANGIAREVEQQDTATNNIEKHAQTAASGTRIATENINAATKESEETDRRSGVVRSSAEEVRQRVKQMQKSLDTIMNATTSEEQRKLQQRHNVGMTAQAVFGTEITPCKLSMLSLGGSGQLEQVLSGERNTSFNLDLPGVGVIPATIVATTENSTHIRLDVPDDQLDNYQKVVLERSAG